MDKEAIVRYIEDINLELLQYRKTIEAKLPGGIEGADVNSDEFEAIFALEKASYELEKFLYPTAYYDELYAYDDLEEEDIIE